MMEDGNYRLRAMEPADAARLHEWENRAEEWWLGATMGPWSLAAMEAFARGEQDVWAAGQTRLILTHSSSPVGAFDLYDVNPRNRTAGVGVLIDEAHRGNGHGLAGLSLLHNYAFDFLGLKGLKAEVPAANPASVGLFERAGYNLAGTLPAWIRGGDAGRSDLHIMFLRQP
jgi:diamine N-acetyltransferase